MGFLSDIIDEKIERIADLEADALRFYNADGSHETLDSAEAVTAKRIECAKELKVLRTAMNKIAYEEIGHAEATTLQIYNDIVQIARAALPAKGGE